jgi:hydrogenase maturation protein HypF
MIKHDNFHTYLIEVKGLVQGVGFRPFIYRLASEYKMQGWVRNTNENVLICINSDEEVLLKFVSDITKKAPPASEIVSIEYQLTEPQECSGFRIIRSRDISEEITEISPDIAVCEDCLDDIRSQEHRIDYPLINCTKCGPRFTIIRDLPYDRSNTTMAAFRMCEKCSSEYEDPTDRRFHAQPVACNNCGPEYELIIKENHIRGISNIINKIAYLIDDGKIVAIKGQGGFHLACDALNEEAVARLRKSKFREGKPFAVMFRDAEIVKVYAVIGSSEEKELKSWRRPIVILKAKRSLAYSVGAGLNTIGCMLPYMPFHYQLFDYLKTPVIVLTSGNLSDEPIIINKEKAIDVLGRVTDAILDYNREIYNRTDDSVVMVVDNIPRMLRRSRGYVPNPVRLAHDVDGILATGAELVNCFCLGRRKDAILSQHIGDLKNYETYAFYTETLDHFKKIFRLKPELIAYDMHPDYLSTRYAAGTGIKRIAVQHHHAHIASAMAEHGLDEKVIGVSFDGTGFGDDGNIWGSEFLVCDLADYRRYTHFEYKKMPGGDAVTSEPWRMAVSYLYSMMGEELLDLNLPFIKNIDCENLKIILQMLKGSLNTPLTSGAGRLFDAVAALLNICTQSAFHAEAPMRLENVITGGVIDYYPFNNEHEIIFNETFRGIINDIDKGIPEGIISAKFHNTIIKVVETTVKKIQQETGLNKVVLSGGTFQNRYLLSNLEPALKKSGFKLFANSRVPSNDGGIALGQLVVAAKKRELIRGRNRNR